MIAGFLLSERARASELGTWVEATGPDGRGAGALRFDPDLLLTPGARDRLVQAVVVDRRLAEGGMAGLVPIADLVMAGEEVWLLAAHAVSPTLSELLSAPAMDPASAAAVLVESAQTLAALHAAGVAHGSFHPGTVLIAGDGATLLGERGLADAIRGLPPAPERDVAAWAALARGLAATWASGAQGAAELFERAAATATTHGLPAARDGLLAGRDALPGGLISRDLLAESARRWSSPASPGSAGPPDRDEGDIVTMLRAPEPTREPVHVGPGVTPAATRGQTTAEKIWRRAPGPRPPPRTACARSGPPGPGAAGPSSPPRCSRWSSRARCWRGSRCAPRPAWWCGRQR